MQAQADYEEKIVEYFLNRVKSATIEAVQLNRLRRKLGQQQHDGSNKLLVLVVVFVL
jgi:hypothetical protein